MEANKVEALGQVKTLLSMNAIQVTKISKDIQEIVHNGLDLKDFTDISLLYCCKFLYVSPLIFRTWILSQVDPFSCPFIALS